MAQFGIRPGKAPRQNIDQPGVTMRALTFLPSFALGALLLLGCNDDMAGPDEMSGPGVPRPSPSAIGVVSGDNQTGNPGKLLDEPFVVRVTDALGRGITNIPVNWSVASGAGSLFPLGDTGRARTTTTDDRGFAQVRFTPSSLGSSEVIAAAEGLQGSPVTFTTEAEPPVFDSARIYERLEENSLGGRERYVLYEDSTFVLQYLDDEFAYLGSYSIQDTLITLRFDESAWKATGTLRGDSLFVEYNVDAFLSGFDDGVFVQFLPSFEELPEFSGPALIYERESPDVSRYVIRDDGTFDLWYGHQLPGSYSTRGNLFTFDFDGDSRWQATGEIRGDSLLVKYNVTMSLSDFLDGVYIRS